MSEETKPSTAIANQHEREICYTPLAEAEPVTLSIGLVMNTLAVKTKKGFVPGVADVVKFMMLCKTRRLNPFAGDAYLVGYDSDDGPTYQLITAIQALRKRAEIHPQYDGCERGVIVTRGDEVIERIGTMTLPGENLVGGWAKCYRKDYRLEFYETVKLSTYSTGRSRWAKDKEGMIVKVAEAAALRRAFPSDVGGLYVAEEFDSVERSTVKTNISSRLADLSKRPEPGTEKRETIVVESGASAASDEPSEPQTSADDEPESEVMDDSFSPKESKQGVQAFNELKEMLTKAMRVQDVEAVRGIVAGKRGLLTASQCNQLAMIDADQIRMIQDVEEAERAGQ